MGCCESSEAAGEPDVFAQPKPLTAPSTFPSEFYVRLSTDDRGDLFFRIAEREDDMQFFATIRAGFTSDKLNIYGADADLAGPPLVSVESTGISGSTQTVIWQDGTEDEFRTSDLETMKFDFDGIEYKWISADKQDATEALKFEAKRAWKLVLRNEASDVLAYFGESKGFHYTEGTARFACVAEVDGRLSDMASASIMKLWQFRAVRKLAGVAGDVGEAAGAGFG